MKTLANFYLDINRLEALKHFAAAEETSVSDHVRKDIGRVISERMNSPLRERNELRSNLQAFLSRYAGNGSTRSLEEIEHFLSDVRHKRVKP